MTRVTMSRAALGSAVLLVMACAHGSGETGGKDASRGGPASASAEQPTPPRDAQDATRAQGQGAQASAQGQEQQGTAQGQEQQQGTAQGQDQQAAPQGQDQQAMSQAQGQQATGQGQQATTQGQGQRQAAAAPPGEVQGRIEQLDPSNNLVLAGSERSGLGFDHFKIDDRTQVTIGGQRASIAEVNEGDQVRASLSGDAGNLHVDRLDVTPRETEGAARTTPQKK